MTRYSIEPRDRIILKGYGFLHFAKNIGKNTGINLSDKYSQEPFDHAQQAATDAIKAVSKGEIEK